MLYFINKNFPFFCFKSKSNSEENCQLFRAHSASLRNLKFHPSNQHQLVSAGYDGCVRIADLNKLCFKSVSFHFIYVFFFMKF